MALWQLCGQWRGLWSRHEGRHLQWADQESQMPSALQLEERLWRWVRLVNRLKFSNFSKFLVIFSHHFYFWCLIFIFSAFVMLCISVCSVHFIWSYILNCNSFHAADCKYKFGNWGECDAATSTKSRSGTFVKALFNVDCQQTISVSKPCTTKIKNKPKGTPSTPHPKLAYLSDLIRASSNTHDSTGVTLAVF